VFTITIALFCINNKYRYLNYIPYLCGFVIIENAAMVLVAFPSFDELYKCFVRYKCLSRKINKYFVNP
jgi:hypothetical protein